MRKVLFMLVILTFCFIAGASSALYLYADYNFNHKTTISYYMYVPYKGVNINSQMLLQPAGFEINSVGYLHSWPIQLEINLQHTTDSCIRVVRQIEKQNGNTFNVTLFVDKSTYCKPPDSIFLNINGLKKGTYTVNLNGEKTNFIIKTTNGNLYTLLRTRINALRNSTTTIYHK